MAKKKRKTVQLYVSKGDWSWNTKKLRIEDSGLYFHRDEWLKKVHWIEMIAIIIVFLSACLLLLEKKIKRGEDATRVGYPIEDD